MTNCASVDGRWVNLILRRDMLSTQIENEDIACEIKNHKNEYM